MLTHVDMCFKQLWTHPCPKLVLGHALFARRGSGNLGGSVKGSRPVGETRSIMRCTNSTAGIEVQVDQVTRMDHYIAGSRDGLTILHPSGADLVAVIKPRLEGWRHKLAKNAALSRLGVVECYFRGR